MSFEIRPSASFARELKRLSKKHRSLRSDIGKLGKELKLNPTLGTPIGNDCYKIRLAISSKGKGKSGGGRMITYVYVKDKTVFLLSIYDKSEQSDISAKRLKQLLESVTER